jgi:hypothetical protein
MGLRGKLPLATSSWENGPDRVGVRKEYTTLGDSVPLGSEVKRRRRLNVFMKANSKIEKDEDENKRLKGYLPPAKVENGNFPSCGLEASPPRIDELRLKDDSVDLQPTPV